VQKYGCDLLLTKPAAAAIHAPSSRVELLLTPTCLPGKVVARKGMWPDRQLWVACDTSSPKESVMEYLHPSIEKLIATAPTSAVAAAIGRDGSLTAELDPFAGVRLSVYVQDQSRTLIIGRWDDCAEATLDMLSANRAAAFLFFKGGSQGREYAFRDLCNQKRWHFERADILRSDSMHFHGNAFIIPWISLTEADGIAYQFGMPAFLYLQRGDSVRLVITG
jgi:hypothetical protein